MIRRDLIDDGHRGLPIACAPYSEACIANFKVTSALDRPLPTRLRIVDNEEKQLHRGESQVVPTPTGLETAWKKRQETGMARFQITFTTGTIIYPPKEFEGRHDDAKKFAEAQLEHYPAGTRYHIRMWRMDPVCPIWVPCDDPDFKEC